MRSGKVSPKRNSNGLYGVIEPRAGKWRVRWWQFDHDQAEWRRRSKTLPTERMALAFQLRLTELADRGELGRAASGDFEIVPKADLQRQQADRKTMVWFREYYLGKLLTKKRRDFHKDMAEVESSVAYQNDKKQVELFLDLARVKYVSQINAEHMLLFVKCQQDLKVSGATIDRRVWVVAAMLTHAVEEGWLKSSPAKSYKKLGDRDSDEVKVIARLADIEAMLRAADDYDLYKTRTGTKGCTYDALPLLWLFLKAGPRLATGLSFRKEWVLREVNMVKFYETKRRKRSPVTVRTDPDVHNMLLTLCDDPANTTPFVFLRADGTPWKQSAWDSKMKTLRKRLPGIEPDLINAGIFRHIFGTTITKQLGLHFARAMMGHSSSDVTADNYVNIWTDYGRMGDEVMPFQMASVHGSIAGAIEVQPYRFRVITSKEFKTRTA